MTRYPQRGFAPVNGAELYYETAGSGYPLLLIHAGVADSRMWDDQFDDFAGHYRVIRYDLRGFGRTMMPARGYSGHEDAAALLTKRPGDYPTTRLTYASYEDAAGLLDFLGVAQAHVVGISFGGRIALDLALAYPERVSALVLGAPSVGGHQPPEEVLRFAEAEDAALERGDLDAATELNLRMWVDGPYRTPEQVDAAVRRRVGEMQRQAFTIPEPEDAEERPLAPPAIERLREVRASTLVLVGEQDIPDKAAVAERLAAEIPGARKAVIPGVAHMLSMEKPGAFRELVLDFLAIAGERNVR